MGGFGGLLGGGEAVRRPLSEIAAVMRDEPVPAIADAHDAEIIVVDRRQPDRKAVLVMTEPARALRQVIGHNDNTYP